MDQATKDIMEKQASAAVSRALVKFLDAKSGARRFHKNVIGDVDPDYCFADYLACVAVQNKQRLEKHYGAYVAKTALAENSGITGGYIVPTELRDDLMGDVAGESIFRRRCVVIPMNSVTLNLPYWDATTSVSSGVAPFWGGMQMSWTEEAKQPTESEPKFKQLSLTAYELGGTLLVSGPLKEDARGLDKWLKLAFARSLAWYEDYSAINGKGDGQFLGVINACCTLTVKRTTPNQYLAADGQAMLKKFYNPRSGEPDDTAVWLFSITVSDYLVQQPNWFVNGPMAQYGIPVLRTLKQPAIGTQGDVIAVDPSMYVIGDREQLEITASPYASTASSNVFFSNQWMWRVIERVGGSPLLSAPINVPDGGSNQVSPVVVLV